MAERVAIYIRVSSDRQEEDGSSLGTQEERCRDFAASRRYTVAGVYSDTYTGAEYRDRPALSRLRQLVRERQVDVVLAYALDRLSRNQAHLYILAEEMEAAGVRLEFVSESFEDSAVGKFVRSAKAFAAEVEREKFAERSMRGRRARAEAGKLMPGVRPRYGYGWAGEAKAAYHIDPITGPIVRHIFDLALNGASIRRICTVLNDEGSHAPRGGAWRHTTVRGILRDPIYVGQAHAFRWQATKVTGGGYRVARRAESEQIELPVGTVPPLVDGQTFAAVQALLDRNQERATRNTHHPEDALLRAGFVRCGYCGHTLRVTRGGGGRRRTRYTCQHGAADGMKLCTRHSIDTEELDSAVWAHVEAVLLHPETIARELDALQRDDPTADDLVAVDHALTAVAREQHNLTQIAARIEDPDAAAPLVSRLAELADRARALSAERAAIEERRSAWEVAQGRLVEIQAWCVSVASRLKLLTWEQKRMALDALGVQARLYRADDSEHQRYIITANVPLFDSGPNEFSLCPQYITFRWTDRDVSELAAD